MSLRLAIHVPSYNRHSLLQEQLARLETQCSQRSDVHVFLRDNCSPDPGYAELIQGLQGKSWITATRNSSNIGGNANIALSLVALGGFDYVWILADDTLLAAHAVETVVAALSSSPDAVVLGDTEFQDGQLEFTPHDVKVLLTSGSALISNVVYRVASIAQHVERAFTHHNTSFPHLAVLLTALADDGRWSVERIPSSAVHEGNIADLTGDYSASMAGYPLLLPLLPKGMRRREAANWLAKYACLFRSSRIKHRSSYDASRAELRRQLLVMYLPIYAAGYLAGRLYFLTRETRLGRALFKRSGLV